MIQVRARYPEAMSWEKYEADSFSEIVDKVKANLSDPENFVLSYAECSDDEFLFDDDFNPVSWDELKELAE